MVKLDRIYTRGGDAGVTSLADGTRVDKHCPRIVAQGEVDEANCAIGLARYHMGEAGEGSVLAEVQHDLFDLGADIAVPLDGGGGGRIRIGAERIAALEQAIDLHNGSLAPLTSFVLPGGSGAAAHLHLARAVVRRAERALSALAAAEPVNPEAVRYLNRLSDLLFVLARCHNDHGRTDVLRQPGPRRGA